MNLYIYIYIYIYLIFNPFGCVLKILPPEQHNPTAVPSVLVCGEVFVFKPFGWERNFKKMIQQPVAAGTQRNLTAAGET